MSGAPHELASNPYAPPASEPASPSHRLYGLGQIAGATFLGTPLAGAIVMALNYRRLGRDKIVLTIAMGALATVAVMALAFVLPDDFPHTVLPAAYIAAVVGAAKATQGEAIGRARDQGEAPASGWRAAGIGLVTLVPILLLMFGGAFLAPEDKVTFGAAQQHEVYFEGDATREDARALYEGLQEAGFIAEQPMSVVLDREREGWRVTIVVVDGAWNDPDIVAFMQELTVELSAKLGRGPVRIALANEYLEIKKIIGPGGS